MSTYKKVKCISCNDDFETAYQGKLPKCKACIQKTQEQSKPVIQEQPKPVIQEQPKPVIQEQPKPVIQEQSKPVIQEQPINDNIVKEVKKQNVICVACKTEFQSSFLGKNPKCKNCK